MRILLAVSFLFLTAAGHAQSKDELAIRKVMADQAEAWNRGSIDDFMKGYWQSDSLLFIGQSGITYGYTNALNNYKKNYDNADKMGKLFFTLLKINKLSPDYCFVIGKWLLKRKVGDAGGIYTLLFRKIDGHWVIVADHTGSN
ncbi:MAG TPA: nuclear transport factor 2 family protein [Puia sp.]